MKTIITIKTSKGKKTSKKEYKYAVDELKDIMDRSEWAFSDKSRIKLIPLKYGVRMVAE